MQRVFLALFVVQSITIAFAYVKDDFHVNGLNEFGATDDMYSGYMPLNITHSNSKGSLFFWLVTQRRHKIIPGQEKLLIWLNGGPGCTSMLGMMFENGPFNLVENHTNEFGFQLNHNPFSWNEAAHVLYVEQPLRTGFSQASQDSNQIRTEYQVAKDFYEFMQSFYKIFPSFAGMPLYISGESYAGFYIPWISNYILTNRKSKGSKEDIPINLSGVAIGNGWIDLVTQTASYTEYAYGHGLISLNAKSYIDNQWIQCLDKAQYESSKSHKRLSTSSFQCDILGDVLEAAGKPNEYNTATFVSYNSLLSPQGVFSKFFNSPRIQEILNVRSIDGNPPPGINFIPEDRNAEFIRNSAGSLVFVGPKMWEPCNDGVGDAMSKDHPISTIPALDNILTEIRVLLYSGEFDLNCNFLGTQHLLESRPWMGREWTEASRGLYFASSPESSTTSHGRSPLVANGCVANGTNVCEVSGEGFELNKLSFLVVRNSGHLLPMDQPEVALDMITRFLNNQSFIDSSLLRDVDYVQLQSMRPMRRSYSGVGLFGVGLLIILLSFAIKIHIKLSSENNTMKGGITPRSRQVEMVAGAPAKEHDVYIKSYQYQRIDVDERANA